MNLRNAPANFMALLLLAASSTPAEPLQLRRFEFSDVQMGTVFRIILFARSEPSASQAAGEAFQRIARLNEILSDWEKDSELNRLVRLPYDRFHPVSPDLYIVLRASTHYAKLSRGAFDVTSGPLVALWRRAGSQGKRPDTRDLKLLLERTGPDRMELEDRDKTVRLRSRGMRIDLGGIAKGYALDQAMAAIRSLGIRSALVDGGGDVLLSEAPPGESGWAVAIESPEFTHDSAKTLRLSNRAIATSGDTQQHWNIDGRRYSHIVDPRSGEALTEAARVTVVAPSGMQADALATALSVLPPEEGLNLVSTLQGTCAQIVRRSGSGLEVFSSDCFPLKSRHRPDKRQ